VKIHFHSSLRGIIAGVLITLSIVLVATVIYENYGKTRQPVFAANTMLDALWHTYKVNNLEAGTGRTIDKSRSNLTTSEGEGYTMLRAVWEADRTTFDQSLLFTNNNLRHKSGDSLFAWQFGKRSNGSYGILADQGGNNTASDGDEDIALALVFASQRWQNQSYLDQARVTIKDIWKNEVITVGNRPLLVADNLEAGSSNTKMIVNPSYFSPASYRIFAKVDPNNNWTGLANSTYGWLASINSSSSLGSSSGLTPDWITVDRSNGSIMPPPGTNLTTQYGYDAMRTPFRLGLDYIWFNTAAAKTAITNLGPVLKKDWQANGKLPAIYNHDGTVNQGYESAAIYGGDSSYFKLVDTADYDKYYTTKLRTLYSADTQSWSQNMSYYDDNWAWFGLALHENFLVNLAP
jgi:endo-1,4-beta-D-glucanase Y